jgi:hypothetical protein
MAPAFPVATVGGDAPSADQFTEKNVWFSVIHTSQPVGMIHEEVG